MKQKTTGKSEAQTQGKVKAGQNTLPEDYQVNLSDFALFLSVMKVKEAYEGDIC